MGSSKIILILSVLLFIAWVSGDVPTSCHHCLTCRAGDNGQIVRCNALSKACFSLEHSSGVWSRTCSTTTSICSEMKKGGAKNCRTCTEDNCNSSNSDIHETPESPESQPENPDVPTSCHHCILCKAGDNGKKMPCSGLGGKVCFSGEIEGFWTRACSFGAGVCSVKGLKNCRSCTEDDCNSSSSDIHESPEKHRSFERSAAFQSCQFKYSKFSFLVIICNKLFI